MKKEFLNYFCCPKCKSSLSHHKYTVCNNCGSTFNVAEDIPILVDLNNLDSHSGQQIEYFEKEMNSKFKSYKLDEWQKNT